MNLASGDGETRTHGDMVMTWGCLILKNGNSLSFAGVIPTIMRSNDIFLGIKQNASYEQYGFKKVIVS